MSDEKRGWATAPGVGVINPRGLERLWASDLRYGQARPTERVVIIRFTDEGTPEIVEDP